MSELETLFPQPCEVQAGGEVIEVTPLKIGEIPKVLPSRSRPGSRARGWTICRRTRRWIWPSRSSR
jgi:hypothetical protein